MAHLVFFFHRTRGLVDCDLIPLQPIEAPHLASIHGAATASHGRSHTFHAKADVSARDHGDIGRLLHAYDALSGRAEHPLRRTVRKYTRERLAGGVVRGGGRVVRTMPTKERQDLGAMRTAEVVVFGGELQGIPAHVVFLADRVREGIYEGADDVRRGLPLVAS